MRVKGVARRGKGKSGRLDSYQRPLPPQGSALPGCATSRQSNRPQTERLRVSSDLSSVNKPSSSCLMTRNARWPLGDRLDDGVGASIVDDGVGTGIGGPVLTSEDEVSSSAF